MSEILYYQLVLAFSILAAGLNIALYLHLRNL